MNATYTKVAVVAGLVVLFAAISLNAKETTMSGDVCGMSQDDMFQCKPAVATGTLAPPLPSSACCTALTHANLTCFCTFKNNKYLPLFGINATRAMQLPSKCDPTQIVRC
ncbi:hypothetical protein ACJIZ3_015426 [Penstemon smallii]|uniref:Bifunctional inhibitor/plant lipid transfer protein/seed storage helical domain-containing protein n=1 Tax=Penstemon smallii TaxID=265156 RepID=A0ABD3RMK4_9LAMI